MNDILVSIHQYPTNIPFNPTKLEGELAMGHRPLKKPSRKPLHLRHLLDVLRCLGRGLSEDQTWRGKTWKSQKEFAKSSKARLVDN